MKVEVVSVASELPISLALTKNHLRVDHNDEDAYIQTLMASATKLCESYTGIFLLETTVKEYLDEWPRDTREDPWWSGARMGAIQDVINRGLVETLYLSQRPASEIVSFVWTHEDGSTTDWTSTSYYFSPSISTFEKGRIRLKSGASIPDLLAEMDALQITYKVGYGTNENDVPMDLRLSLLQFVDHYYRNRSLVSDDISQTPLNCLAVWRRYKDRRI